MNAETTRERLQQIADAALAGNRLLAKSELETAVEVASETPEVWLWQAWSAASPAEAVAALQQGIASGGEHPLFAAGLEWFEGLERLADGLLLDDAASQAVPAPQELEPELALLNELSAIHDEVFAALEANPPHSLDDLHAMLVDPCPVPVVRRSRSSR